jgi:hypothetical protein
MARFAQVGSASARRHSSSPNHGASSQSASSLRRMAFEPRGGIRNREACSGNRFRTWMSGPSSKPNRFAVPVVSRVAYWLGTHWKHAACHAEPPWEAVGKQFSFPAAAHRRLEPVTVFQDAGSRCRQDEPKRAAGHRSGTRCIERALAAITLLGEEPLLAHPR